MKFSDGLWLNQRGYEVNYAVQAYEITTTSHSITVFATPYVIWNRAMTLGGACLELTYRSDAPDVIRVTICHHKGKPDRSPKPAQYDQQGYTPEIIQGTDFTELRSGKTSVRIRQGHTWSVQFFYDGKLLTDCGDKSTSVIFENQFHADARLALHRDDMPFNLPSSPHTTYIREQLSLSVGECVYGFGEKFTPFVKNGQTVEIWNNDGGTGSEQSYKCVPFYLTSNGYGVLVNTTAPVSFEVASDAVNRVTFTVSGETLDYFVIGGANLHEVLEHYTTLTGKPALPPAETFGLWLSTSFTTDYNEQTVLELVDGMKQRNIPLSMFHFDCFWMQEFHWMDFQWDKKQFPDPEGILRQLRERGLGICCWINPYVSQRSACFAECMEQGYFLKQPDGSIYQSDLWQPGMAIIDFTNPAACDWFTQKLRTLFDMGITAIKTDFGERIPANVCYYDGSDAASMHNQYANLYNQTVFAALEAYYGKGKACLFARSATAGGQQFPVHWGGDCTGTFSSMAETLRGGLSLCASGFGYFSHDIGGFEDSDPMVYKRWCAFGLLSSHSRLHGSYTYRVPWVYDEEAVEVLRFFTQLKGKLMPYLFAQAVKTSRTGIPMLRAMVLEFTDDPICRYLDTQYMLGDSLLCAPIFRADGVASFYLPEGEWYDLIRHVTCTGGRYYTDTYSVMELPLFVRPDSILALGKFADTFVYDYADGAELLICGLADGHSAETTICNADGAEILTVTASRTSNTITIHATGTTLEPFTVRAAGTTDCITMQPNTCAVLTLSGKKE